MPLRWHWLWRRTPHAVKSTVTADEVRQTIADAQATRREAQRAITWLEAALTPARERRERDES